MVSRHRKLIYGIIDLKRVSAEFYFFHKSFLLITVETKGIAKYPGSQKLKAKNRHTITLIHHIVQKGQENNLFNKSVSILKVLSNQSSALTWRNSHRSHLLKRIYRKAITEANITAITKKEKTSSNMVRRILIPLQI